MKNPFDNITLVTLLYNSVEEAGSIIYNLDYEKEVSFLIDLIKKVNDLRNAFIKLNNKDIDRLIGILGLPGV